MTIVPKEERKFLHAHLIKGDMKKIHATLITQGISIEPYTVSRFFCSNLHYQTIGVNIADAAREIIRARQNGANERLDSLQSLTSAA